MSDGIVSIFGDHLISTILEDSSHLGLYNFCEGDLYLLRLQGTCSTESPRTYLIKRRDQTRSLWMAITQVLSSPSMSSLMFFSKFFSTLRSNFLMLSLSGSKSTFYLRIAWFMLKYNLMPSQLSSASLEFVRRISSSKWESKYKKPHPTFNSSKLGQGERWIKFDNS